jgi:hypothetical protein
VPGSAIKFSALVVAKLPFEGILRLLCDASGDHVLPLDRQNSIDRRGVQVEVLNDPRDFDVVTEVSHAEPPKIAAATFSAAVVCMPSTTWL